MRRHNCAAFVYHRNDTVCYCWRKKHWWITIREPKKKSHVWEMLRDKTVASPKHSLVLWRDARKILLPEHTTCRMHAPFRPMKCYSVSFNTEKSKFFYLYIEQFLCNLLIYRSRPLQILARFRKAITFSCRVKGNTNVNYRTIILVKYEWNNKNWYSKWARKNMLKVKREDTTSNANKIFVRARPYHRRFAFHAEKWPSSGDFHAVKVLHVSFNNRNGTLFGNRFCENQKAKSQKYLAISLSLFLISAFLRLYYCIIRSSYSIFLCLYLI